MSDALSPRLRALLEVEREVLTPDAKSREAIRVAARAALGLGLGPGPEGGNDPAGGKGPPEAPPTPAPDPSVAGAAANAANAANALKATLATKAGAGLLMAVFVAGTGVGAGSHALLAERSIEPGESMATDDRGNLLPAARELPAPVAPEPSVAAQEFESPPAPGLLPEASRSGRPRASLPEPRDQADAPRRVAAPGPSDLIGERVLLERADAALRRGRPDDALAALDEHEQSYRTGLLAAERDGLRVLARLVSASPDARAEAERYLEVHPTGVLAVRLRRALTGPVP